MPQKLDLQPLDLQPIGGQLDLQPLDLQPISTGKSHGPVLDSLWNFGAGAMNRAKDIGSALFTSPAMQMGNRPTNEQVQQYGRDVTNNFSPLMLAAETADPSGTLGAYVSGGKSLAGNLSSGNYGGAALDAGLMSLPLLGAGIGLNRMSRAPQVLPAEVRTNPFGLLKGEVGPLPNPQPQMMLGARPQQAALPAIGGTTPSGINTAPRFFAGQNGIADEANAFPYQMQPPLKTVAPIRGEAGRFVGANIAEQPGIGTGNIGAELGGNLSSPVNQIRMPNQITYAPTQSNPNANVLPQYKSEMPRAAISNAPPKVQTPYSSEFPRAANTGYKPVTPTAVTANAAGKAPGPITQVIGLGKEIASSMDFSAPLRQGWNLMHRKEWRDSLVPMVKSWASEKNFNQLMDGVRSNPSYELGKKVGLHISDRVNAPEEAFISTLAEKVPYLGEAFKASNRAYTGFLNKLRQDTFDSLASAAAKADPQLANNEVYMRRLADYVNNATGRGSLGKMEKHGDLLNNVFFSPRFVASRVKMMGNLFNPNVPAPIRKEYLKSFLATGAVTSTGLGLAALAGADVNTSDPTSSEFLKAKIGNTRIDPWAGYQQYLVLAGRIADYTQGMATGHSNEYGTFKKPTAKESVQRFAEGKFNPVVSLGNALLSGREFSGQPLSVKSTLVDRFTPMVTQDLLELWNEDPALFTTLAAPAMLGVGVQTYGGR